MGTQRQGRSDGAAPVQYQPGGVFNCLCIRLLFERIDALAQALNSLYKAELICNGERPGYVGPWRDRRGRTRNRRLGPLVQHPPPPPRPGRHHTTTSRKPTHNNTKGSGLNKPPQNPGLDKQREGRCTRYVALHPLCGAAPVMWRCTRYVALHPNRRGVMPTDRVHCPSEQVKVWSVWGTGWLLRLASIIADALQE